MSVDKKINLGLLIKAFLIFVLSSVVAVFVFAVAMYFLEKGYEYSPLFATVSVAVGCLAASFYIGCKLQKNGILIGLSVSGAVFIVVTLITLFVNSGAVSMHILLRLAILLLLALIGGILGVNHKANQKYI